MNTIKGLKATPKCINRGITKKIGATHCIEFDEEDLSFWFEENVIYEPIVNTDTFKQVKVYKCVVVENFQRMYADSHWQVYHFDRNKIDQKSLDFELNQWAVMTSPPVQKAYIALLGEEKAKTGLKVAKTNRIKDLKRHINKMLKTDVGTLQDLKKFRDELKLLELSKE